jgi:hypothetical protein
MRARRREPAPRGAARGTTPRMSGAAFVACANHEGRDAIGVCVRCRRRVCTECTTKLDGINHCVDCFAGLAAEHGRRGGRARREGPLLSLVLAALGWAAASALAWGALELLLPGAS